MGEQLCHLIELRTGTLRPGEFEHTKDKTPAMQPNGEPNAVSGNRFPRWA